MAGVQLLSQFSRRKFQDPTMRLEARYCLEAYNTNVYCVLSNILYVRRGRCAHTRREPHHARRPFTTILDRPSDTILAPLALWECVDC